MFPNSINPRRAWDPNGLALEKFAGVVIRAQQGFHIAAQGRITRAGRVEVARPLRRGGEFQRARKNVLDGFDHAIARARQIFDPFRPRITL